MRVDNAYGNTGEGELYIRKVKVRYRLGMATASGQVCGESQIEVAPGMTLTLDFTCSDALP